MTFHVVDPSALSTPLDTFLKLPDLNKTIDLPALSKFLSWLAKIDQAPEVIEKLQELDINSLQRLNVLAGVSVLKKALAIWEANEDNGDEEFWQKTLATNAFVFSQVFSFPVIVLEGKAYAGGKGIRNTGGGIADFLLANKLTRNTALVEIKTPATKLLGSEYRHGVFPPSQELAGGVIQVTNYRDSLTKEFYSLVRKSAEEFEAFTPPCLVIAGNSREVSDPDKKRCFELFRSGLKDVSIITYDELFAKVNALAALLEGVETG